MPDDVKPDDPSDSAETLRIMADLERYADMHAPTLSDSADVMDEARHRLAVLQQACNAHPGLVARVVALEAENARLRELVRQAYITGADESAGVCVGEHTVVSLADEAASKIAKLRAELSEARKVIEGLLDGVKGVEEGGCLEHLDCWDDAETRWYAPLEQARAFLARKETQ